MTVDTHTPVLWCRVNSTAPQVLCSRSSCGAAHEVLMLTPCAHVAEAHDAAAAAACALNNTVTKNSILRLPTHMLTKTFVSRLLSSSLS